MSKCKHAGKITPNGETKVTTSCGEEYSVLGKVDPAEKRNVIYCAFCGKAIKLKIKNVDAMTDLSLCHDDQCHQAPQCWRYATRLTTKWASHVLTFRGKGDLQHTQCAYFIPTPEGDPCDEPR